MLGDRASACDIAQHALRAVMTISDLENGWPPLGADILAHLQMDEPEDLIDWSMVAKKTDLANLATRAERDGDEYVVNGSKIWSSGAHGSDMGILIARTNPDAPKHKGISYFAVPMDTPGLTMSPIIDMTTAHSFNQVFFDDMRLPVENRIGEEGDGWRLAKVTLANERVSLSSAGSLWGAGPSAYDLLDQIKGMGPIDDAVMRQKIARMYSNAEVLRLNRLRTLSAKLNGRTPGTEASIQKLMASRKRR